jgi:hypothetical protein
MVASITRKQLKQALGGVSFPANKADLVQAARDAGDDEAVHALRAIPAETYTNVGQILASVTIADDRQAHAGDKAAARRSHTRAGLAETAKDIESRSPIVDELGENRGS